MYIYFSKNIRSYIYIYGYILSMYIYVYVCVCGYMLSVDVPLCKCRGLYIDMNTEIAASLLAFRGLIDYI